MEGFYEICGFYSRLSNTLILYDQSLQTISSFRIDSLAQGSLSKIDCVSAPKLGMNRVYAYSDSIFYGSGTFESGLIAKCNQKEILNQYLLLNVG